MKTQFNQQNISSDHEQFSASTQCSVPQSSAGDDPIQSAPHPLALRPCIYIAFHCSRCGSVRQAITELPTQAVIACPECKRECTFVLLGSGFTSRSLPFHQIHIVEPTRWDSPGDGEPNSS